MTYEFGIEPREISRKVTHGPVGTTQRMNPPFIPPGVKK